jgi:hypothetical protein
MIIYLVTNSVIFLYIENYKHDYFANIQATSNGCNAVEIINIKIYRQGI